jgi:hypothetical protein
MSSVALAFSIWSAASIAAFDLLFGRPQQRKPIDSAAAGLSPFRWAVRSAQETWKKESKSKAAMLAALQIENAPGRDENLSCLGHPIPYESSWRFLLTAAGSMHYKRRDRAG